MKKYNTFLKTLFIASLLPACDKTFHEKHMEPETNKSEYLQTIFNEYIHNNNRDTEYIYINFLKNPEMSEKIAKSLPEYVKKIGINIDTKNDSSENKETLLNFLANFYKLSTIKYNIELTKISKVISNIFPEDMENFIRKVLKVMPVYDGFVKKDFLMKSSIYYIVDPIPKIAGNNNRLTQDISVESDFNVLYNDIEYENSIIYNQYPHTKLDPILFKVNRKMINNFRGYKDKDSNNEEVEIDPGYFIAVPTKETPKGIFINFYGGNQSEDENKQFRGPEFNSFSKLMINNGYIVVLLNTLDSYINKNFQTNMTEEVFCIIVEHIAFFIESLKKKKLPNNRIEISLEKLPIYAMSGSFGGGIIAKLLSLHSQLLNGAIIRNGTLIPSSNISDYLCAQCYMKDIKTPLLLINAFNDNIVPIKNLLELTNLAKTSNAKDYLHLYMPESGEELVGEDLYYALEYIGHLLPNETEKLEEWSFIILNFMGPPDELCK